MRIPFKKAQDCLDGYTANLYLIGLEYIDDILGCWHDAAPYFPFAGLVGLYKVGWDQFD